MHRKNFTSDPASAAAITAFGAGIAVHLFGLIVILHNYDNIAVPYGYGAGVTSGRWLLSLAGDFFTYLIGAHNVGWLNGVLGIGLLSAAVYFLIRLFRLKNRLRACLLGVLWVVFPAVVSCLIFKYTVAFYAAAVLLAVLAAWVLTELGPRRPVPAALLSAGLTACSLGIYQAYFPITVSALVLYLLQQAMDREVSWQTLLKKGVYFLGCLVLGLIFYFAALRLTLALYHTTLSTYQGVQDMGKLSLTALPSLAVRAVKRFLKMPFENGYALAPMRLLKLLYPAVGLLSACLVLRGLGKAPLPRLLLTAMLCLCFPLAVNLVEVMCPDSFVYTLMEYGFVMVLFAPAVLLEAVPASGRLPGRLLGGLLALAVVCYSYLANVNYTAEYYNNRIVENLTQSMVTQVRMTEGFRADQKWAVLGRCEDPLLNRTLWQNTALYEGVGNAQRLLDAYSWPYNWMTEYLGYQVETVDEAEKRALWQTRAVQDMPFWPDQGSIRIVDDVVVIRLSDHPKE